MEALRSCAAALGLSLATVASAERLDRWNAHIEEASGRFHVPPDWIRRVMAAESDGQASLAGRPITSRTGAMGLMQLMPGTWADMRRLHGLGNDPYDPRDNILAGTAYLRALVDRFGYPGAFAAYNAGPARYARHVATGAPLPRETLAYVARTSGTAALSSRASLSALRSTESLFAIRAAVPAAMPAPFVRTKGSELFAILSTNQ